MGAHVTADVPAQWVHVALPRGRAFVPQVVAELVPDCGFELRRIEFQAEGELRTEPPGADSPPRFFVSGSGQRITLASPVEERGLVRLRGRFESPVGKNPKLIVDHVAPQ